MPEGPSTQGTDAAQGDPDPRNQPPGSSGLPPRLLLPREPGSPSPPQTCPQGPATAWGPMHSPYPRICTNIRKATLNHLSSLAPDPGELGDFSPKGYGAHGPMPIALPFGCEGTIPWGPSRVWSRRLLVLHTTFHKAHQLPQPLSTSQMQDVHVIPFCCHLTTLHGTPYVPSNPEYPHP